MSPLISARRAAEDFARIVDGIQTDEAQRFRDLTATVDQLRAQETPVARAEFVADLRTQLMAAADTALVPSEARPTNVVRLEPSTRRHNRRLAVAAAAFVVVGGTAGVAAAAENSLPGDPLYPIKRAIESAQVSLNSSDAAKGHDLIDQAGTRLDEVDSLMSGGESDSQVTHTLASFERSASSGADLLFVSYQRDGNVDDLASLRGALSDQSALLAELAAQAPAGQQSSFASATALIGDLDQQARVLCSCGPDDGAADFADLSSAPALSSLLTEPAAAAAEQERSEQAQALADKAHQIAENTPQQTPAGTGSTTTSPGTGVAVPSLPADGTTTVKTVTSGVETLLDDVSSSTGGVLTPVTTALNDTLDSLTNSLLGQ